MGLIQTSSVTPDIRLVATVAASNHPNTSGTLPTSFLPPSSCSIDESYKYVFLPVCYSLTFLFSLTLNSVVLLRSCCHHGGCCGSGQHWNTSLIYMVNLATTDLMYGLSLPFLVASYVLRDSWVFGDFMCRLVRFLFYFNLYCSIFFLTCISVHRFAQTGYVRRGGGGVVGPGGPQDDSNRTGEEFPKGYMNCWDDAIDSEFADYVPYGIVLHVLGFFVPFVIIAWCYSQVVKTIIQTLRSPPSSIEGGEDGPVGDVVSEGVRDRDRTSVSISGSQYSHYIRRRRKSIKTILTITLLFALCFLPFHVTRTLFLLLRRGQLGGCNAMKTVSICYKVTRPLASCNAWLNALLYFLTGDKGPPCCWSPEHTVRRDHRSGSFWWPLKILKKEAVGEDDHEMEEKVEREVHMENESKSSRVIF